MTTTSSSPTPSTILNEIERTLDSCSESDLVEQLDDFFRLGGSTTDSISGYPLLNYFAKKGKSLLVTLLLIRSPERNQTDTDGLTPLQQVTSSANGHDEKIVLRIVQDLLRAGHHVDSSASSHQRPLLNVIDRRYVKVVRELCRYKPRLSTFETLGSALWVACYRGLTEIVSHLLDGGANVDDKNLMSKSGSTTSRLDRVSPLMIACSRGHVEVVKILLQRGASLSLQDTSGNFAIHHAAQGGNVNCAEVILEKVRSDIIREKIDEREKSRKKYLAEEVKMEEQARRAIQTDFQNVVFIKLEAHMAAIRTYIAAFKEAQASRDRAAAANTSNGDVPPPVPETPAVVAPIIPALPQIEEDLPQNPDVVEQRKKQEEQHQEYVRLLGLPIVVEINPEVQRCNYYSETPLQLALGYRRSQLTDKLVHAGSSFGDKEYELVIQQDDVNALTELLAYRASNSHRASPPSLSILKFAIFGSSGGCQHQINYGILSALLQEGNYDKNAVEDFVARELKGDDYDDLKKFILDEISVPKVKEEVGDEQKKAAGSRRKRNE